MRKCSGDITIVFDGLKITYVLSAGIKMETREFYFPSLGFYENYGMEDEECIELWDNDHYLIRTLYRRVLLPWVSKKGVLENSEFTDLVKVKGVSLDDMDGIKELIEEGIRFDFFEEKLVKSLKDESDSNK